MADILGEMPLNNGKWKRLLQMNQATTGRTVPESTLSAMLKGEYDSMYDNYYRTLALAQQKEASDRNHDLQRRQLDMQEDYYNQQNSLSNKLGNTAMQLGTSYAYGAGINGKPLTSMLPDSWQGGIDKYVTQPLNNVYTAGKAAILKNVPGAADVYNNVTGPIGPGIYDPSRAVVPSGEVGTIPATPSVGGQTPAIEGGSQYGNYALNDTRNLNAAYADSGMFGSDAFPSANQYMSTPQSINNMTGALGPYAAGAMDVFGATAAPMTMPATSAMTQQALGNEMMSQLGVAPSMMSTPASQGINAGVSTAAQQGVAEMGAEMGGNVAAPVTAGLGTGLAGGMAGTMVGFGVSKMLEGLGVDGPASGALSGAAAGAVSGSIIPGVGTLTGAIVGGVIGLVGSLFGSWICGMVDKHVGMTDHEKDAMKQLKGWCKQNEAGWLKWYIERGEELVECIEEQEDDMVKFCSKLRIMMIQPVVAMIDDGDMEGAYGVYKEAAIMLFYRYAPHIYIPEDYTMTRRRESYAESSAI